MRSILIVIGATLLFGCAYSTDKTRSENGQNNSIGEVQCPQIITISFSEYTRSTEECRSTPNCEVVYPGGCYCPPEVKCVCGGGPPPICVEK